MASDKCIQCMVKLDYTDFFGVNVAVDNKLVGVLYSSVADVEIFARSLKEHLVLYAHISRS